MSKKIQLPLEIVEADDVIKVIVPVGELYDITVIVHTGRREAKLEIVTTEGKDERIIKLSKDICLIDSKTEKDKKIILLKRCKAPILKKPEKVSDQVFQISKDTKLANEVYILASELYYAKNKLEVLREKWDLWDALRVIADILHKYKHKTVDVNREDVYKLHDNKVEIISQKLLQLIVKIYEKLSCVQTQNEVNLIVDILAEDFTNIVREEGL